MFTFHAGIVIQFVFRFRTSVVLQKCDHELQTKGVLMPKSVAIDLELFSRAFSDTGKLLLANISENITCLLT